MQPKPSHLGAQYAEQFKDLSVAEVYQYRPPYADETMRALVELLADKPRTVLDVGCGTGDLARRLAPQVERVDAVDFSKAMLAQGKTLPDGDHPHLHWIYGRVEELALQPPYGLITAGESLHWMEWDIVLPMFHTLLAPHRYLAIVGRGTTPNLWDARQQELIDHFSTNRAYARYNLVAELEQRHLFQKQGTLLTQPMPFEQTASDYIQSIHSRNGFSLARMSQEAAQTFDAQISALLRPFLHAGYVTLSLVDTIIWGRPHQ